MRKFDVHSHFGPWNTIPIRKSGADDLVDLLRSVGVEKAVVSSVKALLDDLVLGNQETQVAIERHEMLYGYMYVDPYRIADSVREVEKLAGHPKFIGVKSRDDYHGRPYNHSSYLELFSAIKSRRLPALLHTFSVSSMRAAMELAAAYDAPVILAHLAGPDWRGCEVFRNADIPGNVYLDPVSSAAEPGRYELAVELVGDDRVVFGTDCTLFHPGVSVGAIEASELGEAVKLKVYWENPERAFFPQHQP
jgi:predicted TIM-barrel fold metal-dependent hydrolase